MPTEQQFNAAWTDHRAYLVDLAYRMLGDIGRAEDVVQEAFYRLSRSDFDSIEDERGWLIVVTSRLCLDLIGSARMRRERSAGGSDLDVVGRALVQHPVDPSDRVTLDDSVRLALLIVLERLTPAERVAYVLHDIFQVPFETIAETVGRPTATCRQLARRARLKLEQAEDMARFEVTAPEHHAVMERFIEACASGDFEALVRVLDPDVTGGVDLRPGLVVHGARNVARNIIRFWGGTATLVSLPVGRDACILAFVDRELAALIALDVEADRIREIHVTARPESLRTLRAQLVVEPS
jgi:RNA polymerase sigma-70 factor (ECF subfamily)